MKPQAAIGTIALCLLLMAAAGSGLFLWSVCAAALLLAATAAAVLLQRRHPHKPPVNGPPPSVSLLFLAYLSFVLAGAIPMPVSFTRAFGPAHHAHALQAADAVRQAADQGILTGRRPTTLFSFSRNRAGTLRVAALAAMAFGALALASTLSARAAQGVLRFLVLAGAVTGMLGVVSLRLRGQGDTLWWVWPIPPSLPGPVAGFVNRNHFAGMLAVLAPAAVVLLLRDLTRRHLWAGALWAVCLAALAGGVVASGSRGALLALGAGFLALVGLLASRRRAGLAALALLLAGAITAGLVAAAPSAVRQRLATVASPATTASWQTRLSLWRDGWGIVRRHPWVGVGMNGFRMAYPQFRTTSSGAYTSYAENEYVQMLAEGGVVGTALAVLLAGAIVRATRRSTHSASVAHAGLPVDAVRAAGWSAGAAAAVHAAVDFPLHVPWYAFCLATLGGLSMTRSEQADDEGESGLSRSGVTEYRGAAVVALSACLGTGALVLSLLRPASLWDRYDHLLRAPVGELARALIWAPTSWQNWYCLGRAAMASGAEGGEAFGEGCIAHAAGLDPNNYRLWAELGRVRLAMGRTEAARAAYARARALRDWIPVPAFPDTSSQRETP